jgi:hypothetical protein
MTGAAPALDHDRAMTSTMLRTWGERVTLLTLFGTITVLVAVLASSLVFGKGSSIGIAACWGFVGWVVLATYQWAERPRRDALHPLARALGLKPTRSALRGRVSHGMVGPWRVTVRQYARNGDRPDGPNRSLAARAFRLTSRRHDIDEHGVTNYLTRVLVALDADGWPGSGSTPSVDTARRALEREMTDEVTAGLVVPMSPDIARLLRTAKVTIDGRGSDALLVVTIDGSGVELAVHGVGHAIGLAEHLRAAGGYR